MNTAYPTSPSKRCLIADDVRGSREALRCWLEECGFDCTLVDDGEQAWQAIQADPPGLLITDIEMPHCSGLELLQRMRRDASERVRTIPVLVITSLHDCKTLETVRQLGGNGLLTKPLEKHSTYSVILDLIAEEPQLDAFAMDWVNAEISKQGAISPTLRRLLEKVAANERDPGR